MLPSPDGPCGDPGFEPCCSSWHDLASSLLGAVTEKINECIGHLDCLGELRSFVSIGEPQSAASDYIAVWINLITPSSTLSPEARRLGLGLKRIEFGIKMMETGWPMGGSDGTELYERSDEHVQFVGRHAYGHLQVVMDAAHAWGRARKCKSVGFSRIQPVPPSGGSVGWLVFLGVED